MKELQEKRIELLLAVVDHPHLKLILDAVDERLAALKCSLE